MRANHATWLPRLQWEEWDVCRCLFDNTQHASMEANLEYMFKNFGEMTD